MSVFTTAWHSYTPLQRRNIGFYIAGIFCYKFALGSITTLATDRFDATNTFTKLGAAQGLNQAMQCVGAILIAPLAARFATKNVLTVAVILFGLMTTILLITDAATGGKIREPGGKPIWGIAGVAYGMVELIRRVIPADICGGHVLRLRRMDALVHALYEVAGTSAAFASSAAITRFGKIPSYFMSPVLFTLAGVAWFFIRTPDTQESASSPGLESQLPGGLAELEREDMAKRRYIVQIGQGAWDFIRSLAVGARLIFGHRKFCWLFTGYALPLYLHRYLENGIAPAFARRVLGTSAWSQILVGGSNLGELFGALTIFCLATTFPTPIPWLRLDALLMNAIWAVPAIARIAVSQQSRWAWCVAGVNIIVSFGWAAGDVSLAAYIQAALTDMHIKQDGISPLGAVMSFLYSSYIVMNAVLSSVLGRVIDRDYIANGNIFTALTKICGIQFTVCSVIIFASTFIPRGALSLNPQEDGDLATSKHRDDIQDTACAGTGAITATEEGVHTKEGASGDTDQAKGPENSSTKSLYR